MKFGERLAKLRKENKITQKELAMKLGVSRGTIGMYEIGQRDPDTETISKIADFFDVSTDYLLGRTDIRTPYNKTTTDKEKTPFNIDELSPESQKELEKFIELLKLKDKMEMDKSNDETSSALDVNV